MAIFNRSYAFNGITDLSIPEYFTQVDWDNGFASWVSFFDGDAQDTNNITITMTGSNWYIQTLRFPGDATTNVTLTDGPGGANRRIQFLDLGDNGTVDFDTTRVDHLFGFGRNYDISLAATNSNFLRLGGLGSKSVTLADGGRIESVHIDGNSRKTIDLQGSARVFQMKLDGGINTLTTDTGFHESFYSFGGRNTLNFGTGGVGQINISGDGGVQSITSDGYLGSLQVSDNNRTWVTLSDSAGSIQTSEGNDRIITGLGVDSIQTRGGNDVIFAGVGYIGSIDSGGGNDVIRLGSGGAGLVQAGNGNDRINVTPLAESNGARVSGGGGTDEMILLTAQPVGVEFSLADTGFQAVGVGFVAANSIEWLRTANGDDNLIGNDGANRILANGGQDRIDGRGGNDTLLGGGGEDTLLGGAGNDRLMGGAGNDVIEGGAGNDGITGEAGNDRFVFREGFGGDFLGDFTPTGGQADRLVFDEDIWGGGKTQAQVVADYAILSGGGNVILDFGGGDRVVLSGYGSLAGLDGFIDFV